MAIEARGIGSEGRLEQTFATDQDNGLVFVSAAAGLPPFYILSIAAGMLHFPLPRFVLLGLTGRAIRFAVAVFLPHLALG